MLTEEAPHFGGCVFAAPVDQDCFEAGKQGACHGDANFTTDRTCRRVTMEHNDESLCTSRDMPTVLTLGSLTRAYACCSLHNSSASWRRKREASVLTAHQRTSRRGCLGRQLRSLRRSGQSCHLALCKEPIRRSDRRSGRRRKLALAYLQTFG